MTNDERYIIKLNIAQYQAMLKLDIDDAKWSTVARLIAKAEEALAMDFKNSGREHRPSGAVNLEAF